MKLFLSWSGETSRAVASALVDWLPLMFGSLEPFMSERSIDKGAAWLTRLDEELAVTDFGIVCLTPQNLNAPWLLYETGALAKAVQRARVATLLWKVAPADLAFPLARFQATLLEEGDFSLLVKQINESLVDERRSESHLEQVFQRMWPSLAEQLDAIGQPPIDDSAESDAATSQRSDRDVLDEVLVTLRDLTSRLEPDSVVSTAVLEPKSRSTENEATPPSHGVPIVRASWRTGRES